MRLGGTQMHGKALILLGCAGVGEMFTFDNLRDTEMSRGLLSKVTATTGLAADFSKEGTLFRG